MAIFPLILVTLLACQMVKAEDNPLTSNNVDVAPASPMSTFQVLSIDDDLKVAARNAEQMNNGKKKGTNPNPRASASLLSALFFGWILGVFRLGFQRDLEEEDLFVPLKEHESAHLGNKFERIWDDECRRARFKLKDPSLVRAIIRCFGAKFMMYGALLALVEILLRLNQPIFLGYLIRYFTQQNMSEEEINNFVPPKPVFLGQLVEFLIPSNGKITKLEAYFHACGVIGGSAINILFIHPYMMGIFHLSMKIRVACCSLVYRKSLKISLAALGDTTVGQVVNLLSNDVNRFDMAIVFLHYLWIGPLEILIITYLLWNDMGWSAIFGAFIMLLFIPMQAFLGMLTASLRMKTAGRTDERVRQMNEIISGIEVIKMYAWETPFAHLVETARKLEIKSIRASSYIRGVILSFVMFTTRVAIFMCVLSYVLMGNPITAEKVSL